jgi:hypothetical protein
MERRRQLSAVKPDLFGEESRRFKGKPRAECTAKKGSKGDGLDNGKAKAKVETSWQSKATERRA